MMGTPGTENHPNLWVDKFPWPAASGNKYSRGHAIIIGGGVKTTGASRLSAASAVASLRSGAGLVTLVCDSESLPIYAQTLTAVMTKVADNIEQFQEILSDKKINTVLIGPGSGVNDYTKQMVLASLAAGKRCVLDADALTVFEGNPSELFDNIKGQEVVLTPHEGEFKRLFTLGENKMMATQEAAKMSGAVVLLKGENTIIADPDGKMVVNCNAPPTLATAGSGDVLAGIITGLMAAGMGIFDAACAGAWIHGQAANKFGVGLIAEDLPRMIPTVLQELEEL